MRDGERWGGERGYADEDLGGAFVGMTVVEEEEEEGGGGAVEEEEGCDGDVNGSGGRGRRDGGDAVIVEESSAEPAMTVCQGLAWRTGRRHTG